jgi:bifunctional non-homologous end joining protein LigD
MFVPPCEPTLRDSVPKGDAWLHEVKFDGYRMQIHKARRKVWLFTRNGHDWTDRFPQLASALAALPSCIIDAELVATDEHGTDDFATLQRTVSKRQDDGLALWAFDLLYTVGKDIRHMPCIERKNRLARIVAILGSDRLHYSEAFADGERLLSECGRRGVKGIVSKRRGGSYRSGKQTSWVKVKCHAWREANRERHKLFERV